LPVKDEARLAFRIMAGDEAADGANARRRRIGPFRLRKNRPAG
jgi:hypothetical protein